MTNNNFFARRLPKALLATVMAASVFLPVTVEARVLSGSVTERKTNRKITSMLKSARKNYDSGKVQPALDAYWKILELDPHETFAYLELGEIYVNLRIYDRAIELLEPGLGMAQREMDRETICHYYCILTQAHLGLNQTGEANKALIKAAEVSPQNPMPRKILGDIYLANNRVANAAKAYKKALELDPDYQEAKTKLGELTAQYGEQMQSKPRNKAAIAEKAVKLPAVKAVAGQTSSQPRPQPVPVQPVKTTAITTEPGSIIPPDIAPIALPAATKPVAAIDEAPAPAPTASEPGPIQTGSDSKVTTTGEDRPRPVAAAVSTVNPVEPAALKTPAPGTATASPDLPAADVAMIEEQIDKLLAGTSDEKKAAASFFVKLEEKGLTEIEELLYDSDPEVRIIAVRMLPEFKAFSQRVKTMLNDAAEDPDPSVIEEINRALQALEP